MFRKREINDGYNEEMIGGKTDKLILKIDF